MPAPYSAGSIFLQVVPSFRGVPEKIAREARDWGEKSGKNFDESFEKHATASAKRAGDKVSKEMESSGRDAGERAGKAYEGHFVTAVRNAVTRANREVGTIKLDADDAPARRKLDTLKRGLDDLGKKKIGVDIDGAGAFAKLTAIEEGLREIQDRAKGIDARVNAAGALSEVAKIRAELMALSAIQIEPEVKVDYDSGAFRRSFKQAIEGAIRDLGPVQGPELTMGSAGHAELARIRQELNELADMRVGIDIDDLTATHKLEQLKDRLQRLQEEHWSVSMDADTAAAEANLAVFLGMVKAVDGRHIDIDVDVKDAVSAITTISALEGAGLLASESMDHLGKSTQHASGYGQDGANSFRAFNAVVLGIATLGPLVVPALGGLAAGIGGLLPLATASAVGLGVLVLGLYGVGDALKSLQAARDSDARDTQTWVKGVETGAKQVRNAEESLAQAREQAARSAEDSARRVADAQRGVLDAERALGDAQKQAKQAQEDLTQARKDAAEELENLQLRLRDNALDERQSVLDLREAEAKLAKARADGVHGDELERLILAYDRAQLRLDTVRETQGDLNDEQAKWAKTGVEGSDRVVAAQERVAQASRGVEDAQRKLADAQQSVADAQRDQARAAADSARTISHAQEALADAQRNYTEALHKTSSAQDKVNQSMGNLGPAGRDFVTFLDRLRPRLQVLRAIAQQGFLPGLSQWLDAVINSRGPLLESTVFRISRALGDMFAAFGQSLQGEAFTQLFEMINRSGPRFIGYMTKILVNLGEGVAYLIAAMEPLGDLFGGWFVKMTDAFRNWASNLADSRGFWAFFQWIERVGPKIGAFFAELWNALIAIGKAVAPVGEGLLGFLTGIFRWIADMDTVKLRNIVSGILLIITALQTLWGLTALAKSFQSALRITDELLGVLGTKGKLFGWVVVLAAGLFLLYQNSEEFRGALDKLWHGVLEPLVDFIGAVLSPIIDAITSLLGDNLWVVGAVASAWASWKIITTVIEWVNGLTGALRGMAAANAAVVASQGGTAASAGRIAAGYAGAGLLGLATVGLGSFAMNANQKDSQAAKSGWDKMFADLRAGGQRQADAQRAQAAAQRNFGGGLTAWLEDHTPFSGVGEEYRKARDGAQQYWESLTPLEQAQSKVAEWTATLAYRQKNLGENTDETAAAHRRLEYWTKQVEITQRELADAASGLNTSLLEQQGLAIALADADIAYTQAKNQLTQAHDEYRRVLADTNSTEEERRRAEEAWTNQSRQTAEAAKTLAQARHLNGDAAEKEAHGNAALLLDLERQKKEYGELPPRLEDLRASLAKTVDPAILAAEKMEEIGLKVRNIPDSKTVVFDEKPTQEQIKLLEEMGFRIETLPDGTVTAVAETAEAELALANLTRPREVLITSRVTTARQAQLDQGGGSNPVMGSPGRNARGGFIKGPGTWTSDSILSWLSNGEYVVRAASVAKYGLGLLDAINQGRYQDDGFSGGGRVRRQKRGMPAFADGGYVANWGNSMSLSGLAIPELATWWVQAVTTVTTVSGQAAAAISNIFLGLRNAVLANFADTGAQLNNSWLGTITGLIQKAATGHLSITNLWTSLRDTLFARASETRDGQNSIFGQLRDGVSGVISDAVGRATRLWSLLPGGLLTPVNVLIDKVLNNGLFRAFNAIVGALGLDANLNIPIQAPAKLAAGGKVPGWSPNDKADNIPAMLTAGEYVHPVDAVDYYGPDFMEAIRKKRIPREVFGYATGGYVAMSNLILKQFPFARITSGFRAGDPGYHGRGMAIDIGGSSPYPNPAAIQQMLLINRWIAANFSQITELIHTAPGAVNLWHGMPHTYNAATQAEHRNHVHWAMANGLTPGSSLFGFLGGLLGVAGELISDPVGYIRNAVDKALGGFEDGSGAKGIMAGGVRKLTGFVADKITSLLDSVFGGGDGFFGNAPGVTGPIVDQVKAVAARYGWGDGPQWEALNWLINKESGWRLDARNPNSSAAGLFQKMQSIHGPVEATATGQAEWGLGYIKSRFRTPMEAAAFHKKHGYYGGGGLVQDVDSSTGGIVPDLHDSGGWVLPGLNVLMNRTGRPEPVINPQTLDALLTIADGGHGGGSLIGHLEQNLYDGPSAQEVAGEIFHAATVYSRGGKYDGR